MTIKGIAYVAMFSAAVLTSCGEKEKTTDESKSDESKTETVKTTKMKLESQKDSASYGLGVNIAENMKGQGISDLNLDALKVGMEDVFASNELKMGMDEIGAVLNSFMESKQKEQSGKLAVEGEEFLAANKTKAGITTTASGLQYEIIEEGTGAIPAATDNVTTHYHGTLISGEVFDSSMDRGEPASFPVHGVIQGWQEALQLMPTGSKWRLYIPYNLAYGERGAGGMIQPYAALIFDIQLISID
jgi:FKBP-type peptidyl-prolyl cis-trans isomerase FklB